MSYCAPKMPQGYCSLTNKQDCCDTSLLCGQFKPALSYFSTQGPLEQIDQKEKLTMECVQKRVKFHAPRGTLLLRRCVPRGLHWYHLVVLLSRKAQASKNPRTNIQSAHEWKYFLNRYRISF